MIGIIIKTTLGIRFRVTWYFMTKWLENFAYKVTISWWMFVFAGLLSIFSAMLTISYQSIRAAARNPVENLKN